MNLKYLSIDDSCPGIYAGDRDILPDMGFIPNEDFVGLKPLFVIVPHTPGINAGATTSIPSAFIRVCPRPM